MTSILHPGPYLKDCYFQSGKWDAAQFSHPPPRCHWTPPPQSRGPWQHNTTLRHDVTTCHVLQVAKQNTSHGAFVTIFVSGKCEWFVLFWISLRKRRILNFPTHKSPGSFNNLQPQLIRDLSCNSQETEFWRTEFSERLICLKWCNFLECKQLYDESSLFIIIVVLWRDLSFRDLLPSSVHKELQLLGNTM